ncbi:hypothetical protein V6N12_007958 [Hibiscus sabdariffa]|uniref:Uncharacterized protein n=1 Tax=Hibiscus sabdariffa TaxID=183260 RepID=A0ABR2BSL1_9ROSI
MSKLVLENPSPLVCTSLARPLPSSTYHPNPEPLALSPLITCFPDSDGGNEFEKKGLRDGSSPSIVMEVPWMPQSYSHCKAFSHSNQSCSQSQKVDVKAADDMHSGFSVVEEGEIVAGTLMKL